MCLLIVHTGLKCDPSGLLVSGDCSKSLCVEFNDISVGDIATYFTPSDYCINTTNFTRECLDTGLWSGNVPIELIGNHIPTLTLFYI